MISSDFEEKILQLIEAEITVHHFEEWLVPRLPSLVKVPTSTDANIAAAIELGLAELNSGILTIADFRQYLRDTLQEHPFIQFTYPDNSQKIITSGSNVSYPQLEFIGNVLQGAIISN